MGQTYTASLANYFCKVKIFFAIFYLKISIRNKPLMERGLHSRDSNQSCKRTCLPHRPYLHVDTSG